jgi:hypothetical protein
MTEEVGTNGLSTMMEADDICFPSELLRGGRWFEDGLGSRALRGCMRAAVLRWGDASSSAGGAARLLSMQNM